MNFYIIPFSKLTTQQLYSIYKLRAQVFIVEQSCAYQDIDEHDLMAYHILINEGEELIAYARILPPNTNYPQPSIGRVVVHPSHRAKKIGQQLMIYTIKQTQHLFAQQQIVISAQSYLLNFYINLGFKASGNEYLEDNIPHTKMYLS